MNDAVEILKDILEGMVRMVKGQKKQSEKIEDLTQATNKAWKELEKKSQTEREAMRKVLNDIEFKHAPLEIKTQVELEEPQWLKKLEPDQTIGERVLAALDLVRRKIGESGFDAIGKKPKDAIPVILSDGREFYKALGGSGGGNSSAVPYPSINEEPPNTDRKNNPNFALSYTGDNLTQVDMVIDSVTYRKTLTYTGSQLTAVSKWVQQ